MSPVMTTWALILASVLMFALSLWAAARLFSTQHAWRYAAVAVAVGWAAEQLGTTTGLLFGKYTYTAVLGPRWWDVPFVIPLMWFALTLVGWAMAHLLLWREIPSQRHGWGRSLLTATMAAMLVTAFDLGADPYFVYVLKAWVMEKPDGGWFGETVAGFAGWMLVSFVITLFYERNRPTVNPSVDKRPTVIPVAALLSLYSATMVFQMIWGANLALKVVSFFAMGIPLLAAWTIWHQWQQHAGATQS